MDEDHNTSNNKDCLCRHAADTGMPPETEATLSFKTSERTEPLPQANITRNTADAMMLEDFQLDLSTLAHPSPGLMALEEDSPVELTNYCYYYCAPPPPVGKTCDADFVSDRRNRKWYPARKVDKKISFGQKLACPNAKTLTVNEKISVPIYYANASNAWNAGQIQGKVNEAVNWFNKYCITLSIYDVKLKAAESAQLAGQLAKVRNQKYHDEVVKIFNGMRRRLGNPQKFFLVLFVDPYVIRDKLQGVVLTGPISVAMNFWRKPVILIPSNPEINSTNILTHELIHALGKPFGGGASTVGYRNPNKNNTWGEGGCANDMGNSGRGNALVPLRLPNTHLMDWASYWQFNFVGNIF